MIVHQAVGMTEPFLVTDYMTEQGEKVRPVSIIADNVLAYIARPVTWWTAPGVKTQQTIHGASVEGDSGG